MSTCMYCKTDISDYYSFYYKGNKVCMNCNRKTKILDPGGFFVAFNKFDNSDRINVSFEEHLHRAQKREGLLEILHFPFKNKSDFKNSADEFFYNPIDEKFNYIWEKIISTADKYKIERIMVATLIFINAEFLCVPCSVKEKKSVFYSTKNTEGCPKSPTGGAYLRYNYISYSECPSCHSEQELIHGWL